MRLELLVDLLQHFAFIDACVDLLPDKVDQIGLYGANLGQVGLRSQIDGLSVLAQGARDEFTSDLGLKLHSGHMKQCVPR